MVDLLLNQFGPRYLMIRATTKLVSCPHSSASGYFNLDFNCRGGTWRDVLAQR